MPLQRRSTREAKLSFFSVIPRPFLRAAAFCIAIASMAVTVPSAQAQTAPQRNVPPAAQATNPACAAPNALFEFHGSFFERYRDDTSHDNGVLSRRDSVTYGNTTVSYNHTSLFTMKRIAGFMRREKRFHPREAALHILTRVRKSPEFIHEKE